MSVHQGDDPHADETVLHAGADPADADAAVVLVHGRGASARSILRFAEEFRYERVAYLAPQAAGNTWYPNSFMAPVESNEPSLHSALRKVGNVVSRVTDAGVPADRAVLVGFSQGACLASEYVARNARRYAGLAALSGGLIGPEGTEFDYDGDLDGTPVFLGCSDVDTHIPVDRVHETRDVLTALGGEVTEVIYEGMGHTVNQDELDHVADIVAAAAGDGDP
jgi:phospholipase/carboxylesterase